MNFCARAACRSLFSRRLLSNSDSGKSCGAACPRQQGPHVSTPFHPIQGELRGCNGLAGTERASEGSWYAAQLTAVLRLPTAPSLGQQLSNTSTACVVLPCLELLAAPLPGRQPSAASHLVAGGCEVGVEYMLPKLVQCIYGHLRWSTPASDFNCLALLWPCHPRLQEPAVARSGSRRFGRHSPEERPRRTWKENAPSVNQSPIVFT